MGKGCFVDRVGALKLWSRHSATFMRNAYLIRISSYQIGSFGNFGPDSVFKWPFCFCQINCIYRFSLTRADLSSVRYYIKAEICIDRWPLDLTGYDETNNWLESRARLGSGARKLSRLSHLGALECKIGICRTWERIHLQSSRKGFVNPKILQP